MKAPVTFPEQYLRLYEENNRKVIAKNKPRETIEEGYGQNGQYRIFKPCKFPLGIHNGKPGRNENEWALQIKDDGVGFDPDKKQNGVGL